MFSSDTQRRLIDLLKQFGVAALYVLLSHIVHLYFKSNHVISVFEPASGLALAALLLGGKRYAWGVFLGAFLASAMTGITLIPAVAIATGNTLEALIGTWLLTRNNRFDPALPSLRSYLLLILAGSIGSINGALNGTTTLLVSGFLPSETYFINLTHWWMGDVLGIVLITPLILVGWQAKNDWLGAKRVAEAALLFGLTFLAGQIIFLGWFHDSLGQVAKGYVMFLFITWVAVRLGTRGTVIALIMTAIQALWGAYFGIGFFADDIAQTQLANYWLYMVILSVVGMALATFLAERKQTETALRESEEQLWSVMNNAPAVIFMKDTSSRYLFVNSMHEKLFHLSNAAIQGKTDHDLFPQNVADSFIEGDRKIIQSGLTLDAEERVPQDDGMHTYISVKFPLRNASGKIYAVCGIATDITERKAAEQQLHDLSAHLLNVREEEKASIAREIHDELGGTLTALKMDAYWLSRKLPANEETTPLLERVRSMSQLIDNAVGVTRRIITSLRPTMLDDLGLLAALEWQAAEFQKRSGVECRVNCIEDEGELDKQRSIALFRIFQESLTNVSRHAGASRVEVEFRHSNEEVFLSVSDNGRGMPEARTDASIPYGILGMHERAEQLGGTIKFGSPPGGGFSVTVSLPPDSNKKGGTA